MEKLIKNGSFFIKNTVLLWLFYAQLKSIIPKI